MLNKLQVMINEKENNIVVLQYGLKHEETLHLINSANMFATVIVNEDNELEVYIEEYMPEDEDYNQIECRHYKTVKGAYNFIKKMLP